MRTRKVYTPNLKIGEYAYIEIDNTILRIKKESDGFLFDCLNKKRKLIDELGCIWNCDYAEESEERNLI